MLQGVHSVIISTFIKLPFVIKIFVLSIFERPFYTGFTLYKSNNTIKTQHPALSLSRRDFFAKTERRQNTTQSKDVDKESRLLVKSV